MKRILINTFEDIHHVCLMYGLKNAFRRFPFLVRNTMATPPPVRRNPKKSRPLLLQKLHPVNVQYYRNEIVVFYDSDKFGKDEIIAFSKAVIEEYLALRHPYMKIEWVEETLKGTASGDIPSTLLKYFPNTDCEGKSSSSLIS